jgi:hypothetical protein
MSISQRYIHQERRLNKSKIEPLFLLDYKLTSNNNKEFKICGSTKNIYTVTLYNNHIKCDCPDNYGGCYYFNIICKHSCFVLCKVLKGDESIFEPLRNHNNMIINDHYMKHILNEFSKLNDRIQNQNQNQTISKKDLIEKYKKIQKQELESNSKTKSNEPYKSIFKYTGDLSEKHESDVCGICFNELKLDTLMAMCPDCHNIVHINCMKKWMNMGKDTCVYCRSSIWKNYKKEEMKEKGIKPVEEKYKSLI